jgi:solute carrier family 45 protein 1/2/4
MCSSAHVARFVSTVKGAYFVIGVTGFCWAMMQCTFCDIVDLGVPADSAGAPYSLLGELILIDGSIDRTGAVPVLTRTRPSLDRRSNASPLPQSQEPQFTIARSSGSSQGTPLHSVRASFSSPTFEETLPSQISPGTKRPIPSALSPKLAEASENFTPLVNTGRPQLDNGPEFDTSLVLRHSDELSEPIDDIDGRPISPIVPSTRVPGGGKETADKAGIILGIHNIFLVIPQFVVTFLSSVIFYLMDPGKSLPSHHPQSMPMGNTTSISVASSAVPDLDLVDAMKRGMSLLGREGVEVDSSSPDGVGLIFRLGGVSAAIGGFLCWRMLRNWQKGRGL